MLLIPELMRSRAGSEQLLMIGTLALLGLLVTAFILAPVMSAIAAPVAERWVPRSAFRGSRAVWRSRTGQAWLALGGAVLVYAAAQAVGYSGSVLSCRRCATIRRSAVLSQGPAG